MVDAGVAVRGRRSFVEDEQRIVFVRTDRLVQQIFAFPFGSLGGLDLGDGFFG